MIRARRTGMWIGILVSVVCLVGCSEKEKEAMIGVDGPMGDQRRVMQISYKIDRGAIVTKRTSLLPWYDTIKAKSGQKIFAVISDFPPGKRYRIYIKMRDSSGSLEDVASTTGQDQEAIFCNYVVP